MKVALEKHRIHDQFKATSVAITQSLPFVYTRQGEYAHRVRSGTLFNIHKEAHAVYRCWCGMNLLFSKNHQSRLSNAPDGRPVCATCEGRAIGAGLCGSREIVGQAVMFRPRVTSGAQQR